MKVNLFLAKTFKAQCSFPTSLILGEYWPIFAGKLSDRTLTRRTLCVLFTPPLRFSIWYIVVVLWPTDGVFLGAFCPLTRVGGRSEAWWLNLTRLSCPGRIRFLPSVLWGCVLTIDWLLVKGPLVVFRDVWIFSVK